MSRNLDWMDRGLCIGGDPEIFFPSSSGVTGKQQAERAEMICAECPVRRECRDHKVQTGAAVGIWGGNRTSRVTGRSSGGPLNSAALHGSTAGYNRHYARGEKPCSACRAANVRRTTPGGNSKIQRWV